MLSPEGAKKIVPDTEATAMFTKSHSKHKLCERKEVGRGWKCVLTAEGKKYAKGKDVTEPAGGDTVEDVTEPAGGDTVEAVTERVLARAPTLATAASSNDQCYTYTEAKMKDVRNTKQTSRYTCKRLSKPSKDDYSTVPCEQPLVGKCKRNGKGDPWVNHSGSKTQKKRRSSSDSKAEHENESETESHRKYTGVIEWMDD